MGWVRWREPLAFCAHRTSPVQTRTWPPSSAFLLSPTGTCQECMLSLDCSRCGEVCYTQSSLFPGVLDSAPRPPLTIMILLSPASGYCLSSSHGHLPGPHLSLSLSVSMDQLLAVHKGSLRPALLLLCQPKAPGCQHAFCRSQ